MRRELTQDEWEAMHFEALLRAEDVAAGYSSVGFGRMAAFKRQFGELQSEFPLLPVEELCDLLREANARLRPQWYRPDLYWLIDFEKKASGAVSDPSKTPRP